MFEDARVFAELHPTISRVGYKCVPARKGVIIDTHNFNGKALSTKYSAACSCTIEVGDCDSCSRELVSCSVLVCLKQNVDACYGAGGDISDGMLQRRSGD